MSKPTLEDLPPRYQAQARAQLSVIRHPVPVPATLLAPHRPVHAPRLRQKEGDGLNKTERAAVAHLTASCAGGIVFVQRFTLKLANGCRYTPDIVVAYISADGSCVRLVAYEVKGFMRDDAAVKLKVAASSFPWIQFKLMSRAKGGAWDVQDMHP